MGSLQDIAGRKALTCSVCAVRLPMSGFWRGCFRRHSPAHFPGNRRVVRLPATSYRRAKGISGKSRLELLAKLVTIEHFDAGNRLPDNVEYEHPFIGRQSYVPVTRTEAALRFRLCVERRAEVAPQRQRSRIINSGTCAANSRSPFSMRSCRSSVAKAGSTSVRVICFSVRSFMRIIWNNFKALEEKIATSVTPLLSLMSAVMRRQRTR